MKSVCSVTVEVHSDNLSHFPLWFSRYVPFVLLCSQICFCIDMAEAEIKTKYRVLRKWHTNEKHFKRCSTSLTILKMKIKTTLGFHLTKTEWLRLIKQMTTDDGKNSGKGDSYFLLWREFLNRGFWIQPTTNMARLYTAILLFLILFLYLTPHLCRNLLQDFSLNITDEAVFQEKFLFIKPLKLLGGFLPMMVIIL